MNQKVRIPTNRRGKVKISLQGEAKVRKGFGGISGPRQRAQKQRVNQAFLRPSLHESQQLENVFVPRTKRAKAKAQNGQKRPQLLKLLRIRPFMYAIKS